MNFGGFPNVKCPICNHTKKLTQHHVIPRSVLKQLSFKFANNPTIYICRDCHDIYENKRKCENGHKHQSKKDQRKIKYLLDNDWKILTIKSNKLLPKLTILKKKLNLLINNKSKIEIIQLKDWGIGKTFR